MTSHSVVTISSSQKALRVPRKRIAKLVEFVARKEGQRFAEVDIAICDSRQIASVNRRFLSHGGATDVISFDMTDKDGKGLSVHLVISGPVAASQGPHHGNTPQQELMLYIIHGLLHQMGYDDSTVRGEAAMRARQEELLREFLKK